MGCAHSTFGDDDGGGSCMGARDGRPPPPARELVNAGSLGEKVAWRSTSLIFSAAGVVRRGRSRRQRKRGEVENKSWLLAEARAEAEAAADPGSVHSSFRFSFGSQTEAEETMENAATPTATAVLLLVSLEDEGDRLGNGDAHSNKRRQRQGLEVLERSISSAAADLVRFSYSEIRSATRGFSKGRELGMGGLSRVYKGRIGARRRAVAIKRVEGRDRDSAKAFCRELMIATSLRSPFVVPLLGFCIDQEGIFLVYKYVSGGSLDHHLHRQEKKKGRGKVLSWEVRYKVAMGIAHAVEYLHFGADRCVIHRDIKPSNILLTSNKAPMANPLLRQGTMAAEELIDPRLKPGCYRSSEMSRMIHAATACLNSEETGRPNILEVIGMLRGEDACSSDWSMLRANGCLAGYGAQPHDASAAKSDMSGHLALAMLGVSDEEEDLYDR
ncbi:proline-rich receptor-like protein kinase [Musa troglodytarum]|uniref:Proline-rich receptor-like protein kinase n=2 Tax=Musa troglodytarum TaxID=320322 RepID=A0A9E7I056_9LILI|nr:proline-rich receptor-like protein kinase [Musa troglodytarum]